MDVVLRWDEYDESGFPGWHPIPVPAQDERGPRDTVGVDLDAKTKDSVRG